MRSGRNLETDPDGREADQLYIDHQEVMEAGHETSNPYRFNTLPLSDGKPAERSSLQAYYNFVADKGLGAALTELQNDPPPDEDGSRLILTAYHVRANCRSSFDRAMVPSDTVAMTVGGDVQKLGLHHITIAWNEKAVGSIVDYDFWPFETQGKKASACEVLILEGMQEWWDGRCKENFRQEDGTEWAPDLVVVDSGWKEDGWNTQPVYLFCKYAGTSVAVPSKGIPNWRPKRHGPNCSPGNNYNLVWINGVLLAEVNADHWKIKTHEGFLQDFGEPGSLGLFTPPKDEWGREPVNFHLSYAKHVTSERWGPSGPSRVWKWAPSDGSRHQKPNHWLDATALAIVGREMWGVQTIKPADPTPQPIVNFQESEATEATAMEAMPVAAGGRQHW